MDFSEYHVVFLRKGPTWTAESTPELDQLQAQHRAHLDSLRLAGKMTLAGPVSAQTETDLRGISIFPKTKVGSLEELKGLVETDPMFKIGRLVAEYATWFIPAGSQLG
jgi:uncharacterized protein YciI